MSDMPEPTRPCEEISLCGELSCDSKLKITKDLVTQTQDHTAPLNSRLKITQQLLTHPNSSESRYALPAILRSSALGNSFSRKRYTYCVMLSQVQVWELGFRVALIKTTWTTYPVLTSVLSEKICFGCRAGRVNSVIPSDQDCLTKAGSASS